MSFNWPHSLNHSPLTTFVLHHHSHQPFHDTLLWIVVICLTASYNPIPNINICRRISVQPGFPPLHCRILFSSISDVYEVQRGCHHRGSAGNISAVRPSRWMDSFWKVWFFSQEPGSTVDWKKTGNLIHHLFFARSGECISSSCCCSDAALRTRQ